MLLSAIIHRWHSRIHKYFMRFNITLKRFHCIRTFRHFKHCQSFKHCRNFKHSRRTAMVFIRKHLLQIIRTGSFGSSICRQAIRQYATKWVDNQSKPQYQTRRDKLADLTQLIKSNQWRGAFAEIEKRDIICDHKSLQLYNSIGSSAFDDGDFYLGWSVMNSISTQNFNPHPMILTAYWRACSALRLNFRRNIDKMLHFINDNDLLLSREAIDSLQIELTKFGSSLTSMQISSNGTCDSCLNELEQIHLKKEEHDNLARQIAKMSYESCSRIDLNRLIRITRGKDQYDVVIDGLNVVRVLSSSDGNHLKQAQILHALVKHLRLQNQKILIIGRKYMDHWSDHIMHHIHRCATVFLTSANDEADDLLLLYAALHSGENTNVITNDLLKNHRCKLDEAGQQLFSRWQKSRQHFFTCDDELRRIEVHEPTIHYQMSCTNGRWHLPSTIYPSMKNPLIYTKCVAWNCIKLGNG